MYKTQNYCVKICWIFDVDGVITNPAEKKVTETGLINEIASKLDKGDVVTLNTGRSISWMSERVIFPIRDAVKDKNKLSNFLAVAEKGGAWAFFGENKFEVQVDKTISIPESLKEEIRSLIKNDFSDLMFYDESKLTMLSTEMIDGKPINEYTEKQHQLVSKMNEILLKPGYVTFGLKIDPTTIATDIQNSHVGKHFGARKIANWLKEKQISPKKIITIGDSQSDTEMAEELQDEFSVGFVFVGDPTKLNSGKFKYPPIFTEKRFGEGTLEYLQKS
jgi:hydroxymethylpyrimidine pyrophosphatase-like HAD family hydrolase